MGRKEAVLALSAAALAAAGCAHNESTHISKSPEPSGVPVYRSIASDQVPNREEADFYLEPVGDRINQALSYLKSCPDSIAASAVTEFNQINDLHRIAFVNPSVTIGDPIAFVIIKEANETKGKPSIAIAPDVLLNSSTTTENIGQALVKAVIDYATHEKGKNPFTSQKVQGSSSVVANAESCFK